MKKIYQVICLTIISLRHRINPFKKLKYTRTLYQKRLTKREKEWIKRQCKDSHDWLLHDYIDGEDKDDE